jgi:Flp pilus assembly protein protease CpaA
VVQSAGPLLLTLIQTGGFDIALEPSTDLFRLLILATVISYAAYHDIRRRHVPPVVWAFLIGTGIVLFIYDLGTDNILIASTTVSLNILMAYSVSYFLYRISLLGDGDVKLLISIALFVPMFPTIGPFPLYPTPYGPPFQLFIHTIMLNSSAIALSFIFVNLVRNGIRREDGGVVNQLFGERIPVDKIPVRNVRLLYEREMVTLTGFSSSHARRYLRWRRNPENNIQPVEYLSEVDDPYFEEFLVACGITDYDPEEAARDAETLQWLCSQNTVWVIHELPFVVPILIGTLAAFIIGDFFIIALSLLGFI